MPTDQLLPDDIVPVFVLGSGRCGSTLVQEVLARHPAMAFVSNIDDAIRIRTGERGDAAV